MVKPWLKFYPSDWRGEPRLRMCSLAARGLWIDLISYMHEGEPYGHLTIDGAAPDLDGIAALVGRPKTEVGKALSELEGKRVFSKTEEGVIYSRRMVRDKAKAEVDHQYGKRGGNPDLTKTDNGGVNPQDKAQKLEARKPERKKDAASPPSDDDETELFRRGKEVCGANAGGLIARLLKTKGGNIALTRSAIEMASTKENPREYVAKIAQEASEEDQKQALRDKGLAW